MDIDSLRKCCLSLPNSTEDVQWENDLLFRIGGKIFAVVNLDLSSPNRLSFKCSSKVFAELIEREGIIRAPYVARYHWVALQRFDALDESEIKKLIRDSYDRVFAKLPKKVKARFSQGTQTTPNPREQVGRKRRRF